MFVPQTAIAGKGKAVDLSIFNLVPIGISIYVLMQFMVCQITNPKQAPLIHMNKNIRKFDCRDSMLDSDIY